jgi:hypothetical protein
MIIIMVGPRAWLVVGPVLALVFWGAVSLVQKFDGGGGVQNALVLGCLLLATPAILASAERR